MEGISLEGTRIISAQEFAQGWDHERTIHDLKKLTVNIKGTTLYIPVNTKSAFDTAFGCPVTAVKFRTFPDFRVWLTPCRANDENARKLVLSAHTRRSAQLGFAIPLRKLGVTVPTTRQFTFPIKAIPAEGGGAVFEIAFRDFVDEPRHIDAELQAAVKKAKTERTKAVRERRQAERLAKLNRTAGADNQQ